MGKNYVIGEDAYKKIEGALATGRNWVACNTLSYYLDNENIDAFRTKFDAISFAVYNKSEQEDYKVFHASSMADVFRQLPYEIEISNLKTLNNLKQNDMNEQNLDYLKDNIKYLGFGDKLYPELERNLKEGKPEFSLEITNAVNKDKLFSSLNFRKSDSSDMYFLNSYDAILQKPGKEPLEQTFKLDKGRGISAKEAYNLLDGRSVFKEFSKDGQKYHAWQKLDFKNKDEKGNYNMLQFHDNYGYNLMGAVANLPLVPLNEEKQAQLLKSLEKGNLHEVSIFQGEQEIKMHIAANPQFKTLDIYDSNMKMLTKEEKANLQFEPDSAIHQMFGKKADVADDKSESTEMKTSPEVASDGNEKKEGREVRQGNGENKGKEESPGKGRQKDQWKEEKHGSKNSKRAANNSAEKNLLPKKKVSTGKGMSI